MKRRRRSFGSRWSCIIKDCVGPFSCRVTRAPCLLSLLDSRNWYEDILFQQMTNKPSRWTMHKCDRADNSREEEGEEEVANRKQWAFAASLHVWCVNNAKTRPLSLPHPRVISASSHLVIATQSRERYFKVTLKFWKELSFSSFLPAYFRSFICLNEKFTRELCNLLPPLFF